MDPPRVAVAWCDDLHSTYMYMDSTGRSSASNTAISTYEKCVDFLEVWQSCLHGLFGHFKASKTAILTTL